MAIAQYVRCAIALSIAPLGLAGNVAWSAELLNLDFPAVPSADQQYLRIGFAEEIAQSLGVDVGDVLDLEGHPGQISLSSISEGLDIFGTTTTANGDDHLTSTRRATTPVPNHDYNPVGGTTSTTTMAMTPTPIPRIDRVPFQRPLRGISYEALPCTSPSCGGHGLPPKDLLQQGYEAQWGATGRDDLGTMVTLGANSVRLYSSFGLGSKGSQAGFLDRASELGLRVVPGYDTAQVVNSGACPEFDCFTTWKAATLRGFQSGFQQEGSWHPVVSMLVLLDEPDTFEQYGICEPHGGWCRVKAALSALDGVLAAEQEAGVAPGPLLTVTWSFAERTSIDGTLTGPGVFGFQDMVASIANPQLVGYAPRTPRAQLEEAFQTRWVHGINTASPWNFVEKVVSEHYAQFQPVPWFIGEYRANLESPGVLRQDLDAMDRLATDGTEFLGTTFFQFQTAHQNGRLAPNFGLFGLGEGVIWQTGQICDRYTPCSTWPVHCLSTEETSDRAEAVVAVWGGSVAVLPGMCTVTTTAALPVSATTTSHGQVATTSSSSSSRSSRSSSTTTTTRAPGSMPPLQPMRGIAYGALPCTAFGCGGHGRPAEDMLQSGYEEQWGAQGRDDLGVMARLGANNVRLYHSLGLEVERDHGKFLDYSMELGLNVMPGYHTEAANYPGQCPEFDCFDTWREATLHGFKHGFQKNASWHPSVAVLILLNEPDFFDSAPKCQPQGAWCRVKAAISALDGVLAAEKEAGVSAGRVKFTVTWSFAMRESIDGKLTGPGTYGFQDMVAVMDDPQVAQYTPRATLGELQEAFRTRWVHGLNTQSPWNFVRDVVSQDYSRFLPIPWFIGEYGGNGQDEDVIRADLQSMQTLASEHPSFLGAAFFQFQTTYWKGGAEMNFGLFGLGEEKIGDTSEVCEMGCRAWPVHCLTTKLSWLPGSKGNRAQAVAAAWGGSIDQSSLCSSERRLEATIGTQLACQIRHGALIGGVGAVSAALSTVAFSQRILLRTRSVVETGSDALRGDLTLTRAGAWSVKESSSGNAPAAFQSWKVWALVSAAAILLCVVICVVMRMTKSQKRLPGSAAEQHV